MSGFGVNIDGDGHMVGLWLDPGRVQTDERVYVFMTADELRVLAERIEAQR